MAGKGRPKLDDKRDNQYRVRLNDEEDAMLDYSSRATGLPKSEIFRKALQDFYNNTVVVIIGDHLTMNQRFTKDMDRKLVNVFINTPVAAINTKNRIFTPFDIYPTIIESLGAKIAGHRLGLGTSLFSDVPTLTEGKLKIEDLDIEVRKKSKIYDWLLYGKKVRK